MKKWEDFENSCANYLTSKLHDFARFEVKGGSNSTVKDILVTTNKSNSFYIEVKLCPAQCGQFVLIPSNETRSFIFSNKNKTPNNKHSESIIKHMNKSFDSYKDAGTAGKPILFNNCETIFAKWIIETYKQKNTKYFITNGYIIVPVDEFFNAFSITATYRTKRSGSTNSYSKYAEIKEYFKTQIDTKVVRLEKKDKKVLLYSNNDLDKQRFRINNYEYMYTELNPGAFEIRKLSNTFNSNVIFSINLKKDYKGVDIKDLAKSL